MNSLIKAHEHAPYGGVGIRYRFGDHACLMLRLHYYDLDSVDVTFQTLPFDVLH